MAWGAIVVGAVGAGVSWMSAKKNRELAEEQAAASLKFQKEQQEKLDAQKREYKAQRFTNPFAAMENVYEDLTVNQQQAEFEAQEMQQQRANIMQGLRGAAGSSGVASLAQVLAQQGQLATQRISASIGQQEAKNQLTAAKGAGAVQLAERQGQQWVQQAEMDRQATLLGMQAGETAGANLAVQQAQANQMNAAIAQQQITADLFGVVAGGLASNETLGGGDSNIFTKK